MTMKEIEIMPIENYLQWMANGFYIPVPEQINTIEDADNAASLLSKFSNNYLYLIELYSYFKILSRKAKRDKDMDKYEEYVDKRDIAEYMAKGVKLQYQAVSRMITIRQGNLDELSMNDFRKVKDV